ncbi:hypothetical protein AVEN_95570-1 [Araneus ventricosus]|uniref:Uncharacterized protein n=1 Tax=Araneus ventricosus TaxID=182803 RepID=A0A4Y2PFW7_ARAVE|nr:hypothetical protein AVEN_95570-1 [Araneus ventricosus]
MVPVHGYNHGKKFSPDAIQWLDYVSFSEGITIQHALNYSGEKKICRSFVDGYCEENKTIINSRADFSHGCDKCYDSDATHLLKETTMPSVRQHTKSVKDFDLLVLKS